jgi:hypothetical protein
MTDIKQLLTNVRSKVDAAVEENFGYCPSYPWFDNLLDEMRVLEDQVKALDPEWYRVYDLMHYTSH